MFILFSSKVTSEVAPDKRNMPSVVNPKRNVSTCKLLQFYIMCVPLLLISKKHKATGSGTCKSQRIEPSLDASHKGTPNIPKQKGLNIR